MATTSTTTTTTTSTITDQTIIPQDKTRGDLNTQNQNQVPNNANKNNITSPGIVNIFPATIKPDDISIISTNTAAPQTVNEMANGMGYLPIVWYNAYQIDLENIQFLSLYDDGIAPCMKLSFTDTLGLMKDKAFPLDDTKIALFLNSRSEQLKSIFMQFKIKDFSNNNGVLTIDSTMDVDNLYIKKFASYPKMTSNQALQQICKDLGLGYNTNITQTNDSMTWINSGRKPYDFITEVIDHGYISDNSFLIGYIDFYYNLNYIDIQKELSRDISNELGVISNNLKDILKSVDNDNSTIGNLFLTNDESMNGQNVHFNTFHVTNNSTSTSLENGYKDTIKYYDVLKKSLLQFTIDSLVNNSDTSIVLKGSPQDMNFYNNNLNYDFTGKLDTDNLHPNYHFTPTNNNRNIIDTQKVGLELEMTTPNYNIYKFQKIKVVLSSNTPTPASPMINQRLTGDWLIVDIKFLFYDKVLRQVVTLVKRELELSNDELASEPQIKGSAVNAGNRGSFSNPNPLLPTTIGPTAYAGKTSSNPFTVIGANNYTTSKLLPATTWQNIAANFIASKEGFVKNAYLDTGTPRVWRGGYGSNIILINGAPTPVNQSTVFTQTDAINALVYNITNVYGPKISKNLGISNWNKLNKNQKASLTSLGYNAGTGFIYKSYGQIIQSGIEEGNYPQAASGILNGPKTSGGQYVAGLATRRQEEASLFLS